MKTFLLSIGFGAVLADVAQCRRHFCYRSAWMETFAKSFQIGARSSTDPVQSSASELNEAFPGVPRAAIVTSR